MRLMVTTPTGKSGMSRVVSHKGRNKYYDSWSRDALRGVTEKGSEDLNGPAISTPYYTDLCIYVAHETPSHLDSALTSSAIPVNISIAADMA